jgi:eukaryotic-like serine/threonine-protein kinase
MAENGDPFIVMELLTGESLAELLARGRVSATRAVQLLLPIAEALALSHAKGIVHRDLKPDNVFLSTDAEQLQPKLLDFGIAKLEQASASLDKLTEKGTALGSPQYMSPEQVSGGDVDHRSDIWSFCVVLYKAITGSCPFVGPDRRSTMDAIIENEPARLTAGAGVDPQLARLVHWGLAKDPLQRPTSIRELGRQLAQWLLGQGISDDASGAPLAAKWLTHVPEPSMRRPPPLDDRALTLPPAATQSPADEATARVAFVPLAVRVTAAAERSRGRSRSSRRRWVLPLAASVLVIAGSAGVWLRSATSSATESSLAAPMARAAPASKQLTAPAPLVLAAAPQQQLPLSEPPDADARSEESPTAESAVIPQADRPLRAPIAQPKSSRAGPRPTPSQLPF